MTGTPDDVNEAGGGSVEAEPPGEGESNPEPDLEPGQALQEELDRLAHHPRREAARLHQVEERGDSGATPFIAIARTAAFVIIPALLIMGGIAIGVYYLV